MTWNVKKIHSAIGAKVESLDIDAADWTAARFEKPEAISAFPEVPLVAAGDGGVWVPVYVYLTAEEAGRKR